MHGEASRSRTPWGLTMHRAWAERSSALEPDEPAHPVPVGDLTVVVAPGALLQWVDFAPVGGQGVEPSPLHVGSWSWSNVT